VGPDEGVALCLAHTEQAMKAALPVERLVALARTERRDRPETPRPAWRQRDLLARVGGNFYYESPVILRLGSVDCIGFSRDDERNLLLTLRMPTASGWPRAGITQNFWEAPPEGAKVACHASGRLLDIAYPNGDRFRAEFTDIHTAQVLQIRYGSTARWAYRVRFPVTLVSLTLNVANTDLVFSPDHTGMGGGPTTDCFTSHDPIALEIPMTETQLDALFPTPAN
jgi:hypothetical protein